MPKHTAGLSNVKCQMPPAFCRTDSSPLLSPAHPRCVALKASPRTTSTSSSTPAAISAGPGRTCSRCGLRAYRCMGSTTVAQWVRPVPRPPGAPPGAPLSPACIQVTDRHAVSRQGLTRSVLACSRIAASHLPSLLPRSYPRKKAFMDFILTSRLQSSPRSSHLYTERLARLPPRPCPLLPPRPLLAPLPPSPPLPNPPRPHAWPSPLHRAFRPTCPTTSFRPCTPKPTPMW